MNGVVMGHASRWRLAFGNACLSGSLLLGCAPSPSPQPEIPTVSLFRLLSTPSEFHLKEVRTTGFLLPHEDVGGIFLSPDAVRRYDPRAGVRTFQVEGLAVERPLEVEYSEVVGVFFAELGRSGPWLGSLTLSEVRRAESTAELGE